MIFYNFACHLHAAISTPHSATVMKIYLIGYMGSGKTNLGRELAELSGMAFADLDEMFEERYRVSIMEFFEKYGEAQFRKLEHGILLETEAMDNVVISTGGGTPCFYDNMEFILAHGRSVYLKMPVPLLANRLKGIRKRRPLLKDVAHCEMEEHIGLQLKEREIHYLRADIVLEGTRFEAAGILKKLQET
jgi:shikimate kinase